MISSYWKNHQQEYTHKTKISFCKIWSVFLYLWYVSDACEMKYFGPVYQRESWQHVFELSKTSLG